jgi:hypothetical protein
VVGSRADVEHGASLSVANALQYVNRRAKRHGLRRTRRRAGG